jgi:hypothetical protein
MNRIRDQKYQPKNDRRDEVQSISGNIEFDPLGIPKIRITNAGQKEISKKGDGKVMKALWSKIWFWITFPFLAILLVIIMAFAKEKEQEDETWDWCPDK